VLAGQWRPRERPSVSRRRATSARRPKEGSTSGARHLGKRADAAGTGLLRPPCSRGVFRGMPPVRGVGPDLNVFPRKIRKLGAWGFGGSKADRISKCSGELLGLPTWGCSLLVRYGILRKVYDERGKTRDLFGPAPGVRSLSDRFTKLRRTGVIQAVGAAIPGLKDGPSVRCCLGQPPLAACRLATSQRGRQVRRLNGPQGAAPGEGALARRHGR